MQRKDERWRDEDERKDLLAFRIIEEEDRWEMKVLMMTLGWVVCRGALKVGPLKAEGTKAVAPSFTRAASSTLGLSPAWHLDFGNQR